MIEAVLDATALIAFLRDEPGAEKIAARIGQACISAVNYAEVLTKFAQYGKALAEVEAQIRRLRIPVIPFEAEQARIVASMSTTARAATPSLGDRACLSLAAQRSLPALTTERDWQKCKLGVEIMRIR